MVFQVVSLISFNAMFSARLQIAMNVGTSKIVHWLVQDKIYDDLVHLTINQLSHGSFVQYGIYFSRSFCFLCRKQKEIEKYIPYCTQHQAITNTYQKTERKHSTPHLKDLNVVICRGAVDSASTLCSEGWVFEPRLGYMGVLSRNMLTHANTRLRTYFLQNFMLFSMRLRMSSRNVVNALKFQV